MPALFTALAVFQRGMSIVRFGSNMAEPRQVSTCSECQKPLEIENARIDEKGNPIHPESYLLRLRLSRDAHPNTKA
jgi:hypothetical protein